MQVYEERKAKIRKIVENIFGKAPYEGFIPHYSNRLLKWYNPSYLEKFPGQAEFFWNDTAKNLSKEGFRI